MHALGHVNLITCLSSGSLRKIEEGLFLFFIRFHDNHTKNPWKTTKNDTKKWYQSLGLNALLRLGTGVFVSTVNRLDNNQNQFCPEHLQLHKK